MRDPEICYTYSIKNGFYPSYISVSMCKISFITFKILY